MEVDEWLHQRWLFSGIEWNWIRGINGLMWLKHVKTMPCLPPIRLGIPPICGDLGDALWHCFNHITCFSYFQLRVLYFSQTNLFVFTFGSWSGFQPIPYMWCHDTIPRASPRPGYQRQAHHVFDAWKFLVASLFHGFESFGGVLKLIAFMVVDDFKNMGSRRHSKHGFIGNIYIYMGIWVTTSLRPHCDLTATSL